MATSPTQYTRQSAALDLINDHHGWLCAAEKQTLEFVRQIFAEAKERNAAVAAPVERLTKAVYGTGRIVKAEVPLTRGTQRRAS